MSPGAERREVGGTGAARQDRDGREAGSGSGVALGAFEHADEAGFEVGLAGGVEAEDFLEAEGEVGDVFGDVAALAVGFGLAVAAAEVDGEAAADLLEGEGHFAEDFGVVGDGFLALAGEGDPHARDVQEEDGGGDGRAPLG